MKRVVDTGCDGSRGMIESVERKLQHVLHSANVLEYIVIELLQGVGE